MVIISWDSVVTSMLYLLTALQGIIGGEVVHRVRLVSGVSASFWMVFSLNYAQVVVLGAVLLLSFLPALLSLPQYAASQIEVMFYAFCWCMLRLLSCVDVHNQDSILEDNNAHLGPGLALNYWEGLLKPVLTGEVPSKIRDFMSDLSDKLAEHGYRGPLSDLGFQSFNRLVVLVPESCHLSLRDQSVMRAERIYHLDQFDPELVDTTRFYDLLFPTCPGKPDIKLTVHWIYAEEEEEQNHDNYTVTEKSQVDKILFLHDFPTILQSAMGPDRGWENDQGPRLRKENLDKFIGTLRDMLEPPDHRIHRQDLVFCRFRREETQPLAHILRTKIREEIARERQNAGSSESEDDL